MEVPADGTLDVLHRASGRRLSGAHWFEDEADRGDEYNFCPVDGDAPWDSRGEGAALAEEDAVRLDRFLLDDLVSKVEALLSARAPSQTACN